MTMLRFLFALAVLCSIARADEQTSTFHLTGLSAPERQDDLRQVMSAIPEIQLVSADSEKSEVTLKYDVAALFPNAKPPADLTPEKTMQQLNDRVRKASKGTFVLAAPSATPADQLTKLDLRIGILDCKACRYGAYIAVAKKEGVDRASINAEGRMLSIWFDATKTNRAELEEVLKKERVELPAVRMPTVALVTGAASSR
jgi:hypothetical protein